MKKFTRYLMLAALIVLGAFTFTQSASAKGWETSGGYTYYYKANGKPRTGWYQSGSDMYYFRKKAQDGAPRGSMVTGFYDIDGETYYFNSKGVRQKGWQTINGKIYYFNKSGVMIAGRRKYIKGYYFLFDDNGRLLTGWQTYKGKRCYFKKTGKLGKIGKAASGWRTTKKNKTYYFTKRGFVTTGWKTIDGSKYYFNSRGVMQTGWKTISGKTYYLNSKGVMQTGWQMISGKRYYFDSKGVMAKNTTVNGVKIDADGVAEISASVLLVAGHGQGDPGATSTISGTYYQESNLTREFASLIYDQLNSSNYPIMVTMYDQNYDWYKANGYYSTGNRTGPLITWSDYDYILEVHFNASTSKDLSGDGSYKGMSLYVHSSSSDTKVDKAILSQVKSDTGFKIFGGGTGIFIDSGLRNPRLAEEHKVPYGLLETCFIDDKDDMTFYNKNKTKMAKAVANGILKGLGLK